MRGAWCPACGCDVSEIVRAVVLRQMRKTGARGGRARAAALSPQRRREIAQHAARTRWSKGG